MKKILPLFKLFLKDYVVAIMLLAFVFIGVRLVEFLILLNDSDIVFQSKFRSLTYALEFDFIFLAIYFLCFSLIYFGVYLIHKNAFKITFHTLSFILIALLLFLTQFFHTSDLLLDKTIFFFSWKELMIIAGGESGALFGDFFWLYFVAIVLYFSGVLYLFKIIRHHKGLRIISQLFTVVILALFLFRGEATPQHSDKYSHYETQLHSSKTTFFFKSILKMILHKKLDVENHMEATLAFREALDIEGDLAHVEFPFLKPIDQFQQNDWSKYMDVSDSTNIVIIFAEGMAKSFFGPDAHYGNMMPFLDSLSRESLYWPNMMSITDRTHGVFSAALAGLPHGFERGFLNYNNQPKPSYLSLPKILKKEGYELNFFYGGWSYFDNYRTFLTANDFDNYIDEDYLDTVFHYPKEKTEDNFSWGYHDHISSEAYFRFMDQRESSSPYLNIYLTLSLHTPFDIPNRDSIEKVARKKLTGVDSDFFDKAHDIVSTVYYTDESLRNFFKKYKERPEYDQTVFLIFGDHNVRSMGLISDIDDYHVPFLIYSPSIKKPQTFNEIVSHWDVPITILDLIPQIDQTSSLTHLHWLGTGVEFNQETASNSPIFLGTFRGDINGVLWKDEVLIHDQLYKINHKMELIPYDNTEQKEKLSHILELYKWLNEYVMLNNKFTTQKQLNAFGS